MSEKNISIENNLNQTYCCGKDFRSVDNSCINSFNDKDKRINNSYTQPSSYNYNIISNRNNNSLNSPPILNDDDYIKERYSIIKEENSELKKKLFNLEKGYKIKKGEMEEKILILRDENSNLQLQIQKTIEKHKDAFKNNDDIFNMNKTLLNDINKLKNEVNILKDSITRKNAEIEEKNKIINDLLEEKNMILEEESMYKNQISNLEKDKEILINQIQDLNVAISDKIAPKLKQNENSLINLQDQIENLRMDNEKYKSDNTVLFNESKTQKNLIKILAKQNKKLLREIKIIHDRDLMLMNNMDKIDSNNSSKFKIFFEKRSNDNRHLLEEEMSILKQSQKFIDDDDDEQCDGNYEKNKEEENSNFASLEITEDADNIRDVIKKGNNDSVTNNEERNNESNINELNEISSIINNEIIVKKNIGSINNDDDISTINSNLVKSKNFKKKLFNNNYREDVNKYKAPILSNTFYKNMPLNLGFNSNRIKEIKSKNKSSKKYDKHLKLKSLTIAENKRINFRDRFEGIKAKKLKLSDKNNNMQIKNIHTKRENDISNERHLYTMDGKLNLKNNFTNTTLEQSKNNYSSEENDNNQMNEDMSYENKALESYNSNTIESGNNNNSNALLYSQAKSLLSEYVEDLDVI